jgi:hypothetical protein
VPDHELAMGLQEWAGLCRALGDGRLVLTVRKGGIHERGGGMFVPEHERFVLLPSHLHQDQARVTAPFTADVQATQDEPRPGSHRLAVWAEVVKVWKVTDLTSLFSLGPELLWTPQELETRFAYRDQPWLHVLALRVLRFPVPIDIPDHPSYAGCRSWIALQTTIPTMGSIPVLSAGYFEARLERINAALSPGNAISRTMSASRRPRPL